MGLGPEDIVIVLITNSLIFEKTFCIKKILASFLRQPQSWILHFGILSSSAMGRREDSRQRMLGPLPWIDSQFVGLCAEL